ncbi:hypothetical protein MRX96_021891 [Rhipicephalus microplus]
MTEDAQRNRRVAVVVLGDFGRSPRMNYHALSLAKERIEVDVVAYSGSQPGQEKYVPRLLAYALKVLWQSLALFFRLMFLCKPSHVLVQNPPSIPTLPVSWFCCLLRGSVLVVDWHNYGYSILALALGPEHLLVRLCHWCEETFGKKAGSAFCVSQAMQEDLKSNWGVQADVLYDKPSSAFQSNRINAPDEAGGGNIFTEAAPDFGAATLRADRPALIVSSTSWTEDEDFSVLLDALMKYDIRKGAGDSGLPDLFCAITGKGLLKEYYRALIHNHPLTHVKFLMPWLSAQDYAPRC